MLKITVSGMPNQILSLEDDTAALLAESISRVLGNTISYGAASPMPCDYTNNVTVVHTYRLD